MPQLALRLCITLAQRVQELTEASRNLLPQRRTPPRFAQWLLQRCPGARASVVSCICKNASATSPQQLAMTPETLSRLFRNFETPRLWSALGVTDLTVHNLGALRALAGSPAAI